MDPVTNDPKYKSGPVSHLRLLTCCLCSLKRWVQSLSSILLLGGLKMIGSHTKTQLLSCATHFMSVGLHNRSSWELCPVHVYEKPVPVALGILLVFILFWECFLNFLKRLFPVSLIFFKRFYFYKQEN